MSEVNCEVIEDLLPLYVENIASPSSRVLVEEHLASCESCRELEKSMRTEVHLPKDIDTKPLKRISSHLFRKKVTAVALTALIMTLLALLLIVHLNSPITIPYEQISDSIEVEVSDDGKVSITMDNPGGRAEFSNGYDEDGSLVKYIRCYTTRWNILMGKESGRGTFEIGGTEYTGEETVKKVYYYPSVEKGEAMLLYEAKGAAANTSQGVIILPRLTLNYYTLLAGMLTLIGVVCCVVFRKKPDRFYRSLKGTLLPTVYAISSLVILSGKGEIYDIEYYFTGILLVSAVAVLIIYWLIDYLRFHGKIK